MTSRNFRDLIVWQKSQDLVIGIYEAFRDTKDFSFKDQIQRASLSVSNNIAEGYSRRSDKAFGNFLSIAKGSVAEVESMLLLASRLGYIDKDAEKHLIDEAHQVTKLITAFKKKLWTMD